MSEPCLLRILFQTFSNHLNLILKNVESIYGQNKCIFNNFELNFYQGPKIM